MTADFAYDPVTAIDEANAVGETAASFAEIRQTMRIPLVTSIWRGLAGMDDSLPLAWAAAKLIYESGERGLPSTQGFGSLAGYCCHARLRHPESGYV
jgi:hypothetical protein